MVRNQNTIETTLAEIGATAPEAVKKLKDLLPHSAGTYDIKTTELGDKRYLAMCTYTAQADEKAAKTGTGSYRSPLARDE